MAWINGNADFAASRCRNTQCLIACSALKNAAGIIKTHGAKKNAQMQEMPKMPRFAQCQTHGQEMTWTQTKQKLPALMRCWTLFHHSKRRELLTKKGNRTHPIPPGALRRNVPQFGKYIYPMPRSVNWHFILASAACSSFIISSVVMLSHPFFFCFRRPSGAVNF